VSGPVPVLLVESGHDLGGTERIVDALARGLDRDQFQPWIVLSDAAALDEWADELRREGIPVERRPEITNRLQWTRMASWFSFLRRHRHSLLHVHHVWPSADRYLVPIAQLAGMAAVVVTDHLAAPPHSSWQRGLKRWEAARADAHVAVSQAVADSLASDYGFLPHSVEVIPNGIAPPPVLSPSDRQAVRARLGVHDERRIWLFVGRLEKQKGLDVLLPAWAALPEPRPHLALVGAGSEEEALRAQVKDLGVAGNVHFAGAWSRADRAYGAADAFVLPSRFEGMPLALLEALCAGIPVVATRVGGIEEATEGGARARLVPAEDPAALAEAVGAVEADREQARERARRDAEWALEQYGAERMVEDYESLYRRVLRRTRMALGRSDETEAAA
jgi:glycosyltransferase involved in cell wall biosynthesis